MVLSNTKKHIACLMITIFLFHGWQNMAWSQVGNAKNRIEFGNEAAVFLKGEKITIGDAIRLAIESNFDIISGAYELAMLDTNYRMTQKKYSPFLLAEAKGEYQEFPESTAVLSGVDQKTWAASAALAKAFPTGTQISLGLAHTNTNTTYLPLTFSIPGLGTVSMPAFGDSGYYRSNAFLSLKQELLQNGFGYNEQREQKQIVNAALMQKDIILYQLSLVVVKVVMDYWNVALKESALANAELQYRETKSVRDITAGNVSLGKANQFELHYYNVLLAAARSQKLMAAQEYNNAKRSFLRSINLDDGSVLDGPAVLVDKLPDLEKEKSLSTAYEKRADYLAASRMLEHARWELEISRNLALPALSAELSFNTMGQKSVWQDSFSDMSGMDKIGYSGKLSLTYPLGGDPVQKVKLRNALFTEKQAEIALKKYERQIADEIEEQIEQLNTIFFIYENAKDARYEAETFYNLMLEQLRRGRLNAATVKNGVDALAQSRQQELAILIQFNMANLQFIVTKNELFEKYGIDPEKYIPK